MGSRSSGISPRAPRQKTTRLATPATIGATLTTQGRTASLGCLGREFLAKRLIGFFQSTIPTEERSSDNQNYSLVLRQEESHSELVEMYQRLLWISRSRIVGRGNRISGNGSVSVGEIRRYVGCNCEISKEPPAVGDFDQAGAVVTEGVADSGAELIGSLDPVARDVEGGCQGEEVRVGQIDVDMAALEDVLLDVLDGSVGRVVVNQGDEGETMPNGRGEFLGGHQEAAVAADRDDVPARQGHGRADRRGEGPAQGNVVRWIKELARAERWPVGLHPVAHLAGVGEHGGGLG